MAYRDDGCAQWGEARRSGAPVGERRRPLGQRCHQARHGAKFKPQRAAVTSDYVFDLDTLGGAPLLSVFGGKITTFRKLAEHALERLRPTFPKMGEPWTATGVLPGGEIDEADIPRFLDRLQRGYPWL